MNIDETVRKLRPGWPRLLAWLYILVLYWTDRRWLATRFVPVDWEDFDGWLTEYAWATHQEDQLGSFEGWLCDCGHWEDSNPCCCSYCGRESPWGCVCGGECRDGWDDEDDRDEWLYMWEDYPGDCLP